MKIINEYIMFGYFKEDVHISVFLLKKLFNAKKSTIKDTNSNSQLN